MMRKPMSAIFDPAYASEIFVNMAAKNPRTISPMNKDFIDFSSLLIVPIKASRMLTIREDPPFRIALFSISPNFISCESKICVIWVLSSSMS